MFFFNSIRETEKLLHYGGVLADDMLTSHPIWEMPLLALDGKDVDSRSSLTGDRDGNQHSIPGIRFANWQYSSSLECSLHHGPEMWTPMFLDGPFVRTRKTTYIRR